MPKIDSGPTEGPYTPQKTAWVMFTITEAKELLATLREWDDDVSHGRIEPGTHWHMTDSDGNELSVEILGDTDA